MGDGPFQRDLLIEYLHAVQDRYGHLSAAHLRALADEMKMAQSEVYEVATFYHHFDVVKEGQQPPPELTVRVCDSITCELFGARVSAFGELCHLGERRFAHQRHDGHGQRIGGIFLFPRLGPRRAQLPGVFAGAVLRPNGVP